MLFTLKIKNAIIYNERVFVMNATVILAKCTLNKQLYGIRTQQMSDGDWYRTWAFPVSDALAHSEKYDQNSIKGTLNYLEEYPGCPYCNTKGFVQCGKCKKISCWNGENSIICPWCNTRMNSICIVTEKFKLSGGEY